jgi:hypothetical protein
MNLGNERGLGAFPLATIRARRKRLEPLSEECIDYLISVVRAPQPELGEEEDPGRILTIDQRNRIQASKIIIEENRWLTDCEREDEKPLKELVAILGSPAAALAWMRAKLPQLEAEVMGGSEAVAAAKQLTEGGKNGGR